jgi:hypothetical protein
MLRGQILEEGFGNTHVTCELKGSRKRMGFRIPPCRLFGLKGELSAGRACVRAFGGGTQLNIAALSAGAPA